MHYVAELLILPGNTPDNPARAFITVPQGIIARTDIFYSENVNGTNLVQIFLEGQQLYPNQVGTAYRLWKYPITIRDVYPLHKEENDIEIRGWAYRARFHHVITIMINILPFSTKIRKVNIW